MDTSAQYYSDFEAVRYCSRDHMCLCLPKTMDTWAQYYSDFEAVHYCSRDHMEYIFVSMERIPFKHKRLIAFLYKIQNFSCLFLRH